MLLTTNNRVIPVIGLLATCGLCASTLATPTAMAPIGGQSIVNTAPPATISIAGHFTDPGVTVVRFRFVPGPGFTQAPVPTPGPLPDFGNVDIAVFNSRRPITATNFLNYVDRPATAANSIQNTVIHRSVPGFVIQGGGFKQPTADNAAGTAVTTDPPIQNEYNAAEPLLLSNIRGTLAMAKLGTGPNTATCQYFFNLADNSANLNNQNGGFTVFARVLGGGMAVVDAIAALTFYNLDGGATFGAVPLNNVYPWQTSVLRHNWVNAISITRHPEVDPLTYSVVSGDTQVLGASLAGTTLTVTPVAGKAGSVPVTITAVSADLTSTTATFYVRVVGACGAADIAALGGSLGPDNHVTADDLVAFLNAFFAGSIAVADIASLGGAAVPDGQLSADDLIAFLSAFFTANCP